MEYKNVLGVSGNVRVVTMGIKLDEEHPIVNKPPPKIGDQNLEIYSDLGLTKNEIYMLKKRCHITLTRLLFILDKILLLCISNADVDKDFRSCKIKYSAII